MNVILLQRQGTISTGNPCPICRDEYLVLDHRNIDLLKQFVSPFNGGILPTKLVFVQNIKLSEFRELCT